MVSSAAPVTTLGVLLLLLEILFELLRFDTRGQGPGGMVCEGARIWILILTSSERKKFPLESCSTGQTVSDARRPINHDEASSCQIRIPVLR